MYKDLSKADLERMFGKADEIWQRSVDMTQSEYDQCVAEEMLLLKHPVPSGRKNKKEIKEYDL